MLLGGEEELRKTGKSTSCNDGERGELETSGWGEKTSKRRDCKKKDGKGESFGEPFSVSTHQY